MKSLIKEPRVFTYILLMTKENHKIDISFSEPCTVPHLLGGREYLFQKVSFSIGDTQYPFIADFCEPLNSFYTLPSQFTHCLKFIGGFVNSSYFNKTEIEKLTDSERWQLVLELRKSLDSFIERRR